MKLSPLLNHKETAKVLNIAAQTLYNWRHSRKGPDYILIGNKPMYRIEDIEKFIESKKIVLSEEN